MIMSSSANSVASSNSKQQRRRDLLESIAKQRAEEQAKLRTLASASARPTNNAADRDDVTPSEVKVHVHYGERPAAAALLPTPTLKRTRLPDLELPSNAPPTHSSSNHSSSSAAAKRSKLGETCVSSSKPSHPPPKQISYSELMQIAQRNSKMKSSHSQLLSSISSNQPPTERPRKNAASSSSSTSSIQHSRIFAQNQISLSSLSSSAAAANNHHQQQPHHPNRVAASPLTNQQQQQKQRPIKPTSIRHAITQKTTMSNANNNYDNHHHQNNVNKSKQRHQMPQQQINHQPIKSSSASMASGGIFSQNRTNPQQRTRDHQQPIKSTSCGIFAQNKNTFANGSGTLMTQRRRGTSSAGAIRRPKSGRQKDGEGDDEYDDEEEDDSEMDDFIADSDEECDAAGGGRIRAEIHRALKFDPSRYDYSVSARDNLRNMETGFAGVEREERQSAAIGRRIDAQEAARDLAEKQRKLNGRIRANH